MPELNQRPKVTVEDLLRLKRAERPEAEFWTKFERELRQKQLTALMEKRPWWQELPQFLARRAYLPVGATAILAFTLVSVKYYAPTQLAQVEPAPVSVPTTPDREVVAPVVERSSPLVNRRDVATTVVEDSAPSAVATAAPAAAPTEAVDLMPLLVPTPAVEKPSDRLLAASLNRTESANADFGQPQLGSRLNSAPERVAPAAEELASIPTGSVHRNRLLARYEGRQISPEPTLPEAVRQKLVRRLGDPDPDRAARLAREMDSMSMALPQVSVLRF
ncbi:MAG TPA: hypothetical protein VF388_03390 [Lacunisphaera sp.]